MKKKSINNLFTKKTLTIFIAHGLKFRNIKNNNFSKKRIKDAHTHKTEQIEEKQQP